ncbi:MAG: MBL fold metallo-hydrolase [Promethearchaeota archaeon]
MKITSINNHASILIESGDQNIYIDPVFQTHDRQSIDPTYYKEHPATVILISHNHWDHYDPVAVNAIMTENTEIICPATCDNILHDFEGRKIKGVKPGEKLSIANNEIEILPSYNPEKQFHPKQNEWLGFLVTTEGKRLYFSGDTEYIPEMEQLKGNVDIAFLHVGGTYTMDFEQGIHAVKTIQPKIVVPIHLFGKNPKRFEKECKEENPEVEIYILENQHWKL